MLIASYFHFFVMFIFKTKIFSLPRSLNVINDTLQCKAYYLMISILKHQLHISMCKINFVIIHITWSKFIAMIYQSDSLQYMQ